MKRNERFALVVIAFLGTACLPRAARATMQQIEMLPLTHWPVSPMTLPSPSAPGDDGIQHPLRLPSIAVPGLPPTDPSRARIELPAPGIPTPAAPAPAPMAVFNRSPKVQVPSGAMMLPVLRKAAAGKAPAAPELDKLFDNARIPKPAEEAPHAPAEVREVPETIPPLAITDSRRYTTPETDLEEELGIGRPAKKR